MSRSLSHIISTQKYTTTISSIKARMPRTPPSPVSLYPFPHYYARISPVCNYTYCLRAVIVYRVSVVVLYRQMGHHPPEMWRHSLRPVHRYCFRLVLCQDRGIGTCRSVGCWRMSCTVLPKIKQFVLKKGTVFASLKHLFKNN